jgi:hypothetical protein
MRRDLGGRVSAWLLGGLLLLLGCVAASLAGQPATEKPAPPAKKGNQAVAPSAPPEAWLKSDAWKDVPATPLQPGEIDQLLAKEYRAAKVVVSPLTTDEQFLRRVGLDLTGQLPTVAEIEQFLADPDPHKRAKWIDQLLDSDAYARHWARYWRDTVKAVEAPFGDAHGPAFEAWLFDQLKQNRNWGEIVRSLLTATGALKKGDPGTDGALFFLGRHSGPDAAIVQTAETARLFLGIQIQCAQCHNDRRTKLWKQVQFHEMAGFFARMAVGGSSGSLIKVSERKNGEHKMPDRTNPKQGFITYPRFLDGKAPPANAGDQERRQALADSLTAPDNYWFAAAYVNRIWNELLGQGFYERVDDLSPRSPVLFPAVAHRLAAAFAGSNYDTKELMRAVVIMRDGHGSIERSPIPGQLLPAVLARGGVEPAGAAASGDRRPAASARGRRARGGVTGGGAETLSERAPSSGSIGRGTTSDVALALNQGGGVRGGELPPHRGSVERQLAEPAIFEQVRQHVCRRPAVAHFWTG